MLSRFVELPIGGRVWSAWLGNALDSAQPDRKKAVQPPHSREPPDGRRARKSFATSFSTNHENAFSAPMRVTAILFDLDGTLLDTLGDIAEAANRVLSSFAFPTHPIAAYRNFIGEGVTQLFKYILPAADCTDEQIESCSQEFREVYESHWNVHTAPYAGVDALLERLQAQALRMAVLSNKPHRFTEKCVETFLAGHSFEVVLGQREGVPQAPSGGSH